MALAQQDFAKLMSPLKNALLGFFVALSPGTLDAASAKALNQAVEETVQNLAKTESEKAKDQALEEALQNFGPDQATDTDPEPHPSEPDIGPSDQSNFNNDKKNATISPKEKIPEAYSPKEIATKEAENQEDQKKQNPDAAYTPEEIAAKEAENQEDQKKGSEEESRELSPEEIEQKRLDEEQAKLPTEKGAITQGINGLINGSRIKALKKQVKNLENKAKMWELAIRHQEKRISSLTRDKSRTEKKIKFKKTSITILKVFTWTLGFIIFFFLVPGAKIAQLKMESTLKTLQEHLESIIGKVANTQKNIADITKKITEIKQEIQKIVMTIYELYNENSLVGLVSGAARRISSKK